jgi:hypothetical protein
MTMIEARSATSLSRAERTIEVFIAQSRCKRATMDQWSRDSPAHSSPERPRSSHTNSLGVSWSSPILINNVKP